MDPAPAPGPGPAPGGAAGAGAGAAAAAEPQLDTPLFAAFVDQLADPDPAIRSHACWVLGQLRFRPSQRRVARVLSKDPDALVRVAAAQALAHMGGSGAAQALIRGLKDSDELVQETCVVGLGTLRDPQGLGPLEELRRRHRDDPAAALRRLDWAIGLLKENDEPGTTVDRRRGGISRKIGRYLEQVQEQPRSGNAHNNLAVAYFHAAEHDLAVRHYLLAKALGAQVDWLRDQLAKVGHDPAKAALSEEDKRFLAAGPTPLKLQPEPGRVELRAPLESEEGVGPESGSRMRD